MPTKKTAHTKTSSRAAKKAPAAKRVAARKSSAKKTSMKKTSRKDTAAEQKQCFACRDAVAPQEQCFWVYDGPVIDSITHLIDALEKMTQHQYSYHARGEQNDFAVWVRDVFGFDECADALLKVRSKSGAIRALKACCACT